MIQDMTNRSSIHQGHREGTDIMNLLYMGYGLMAAAVLGGIASGIIFQGKKKRLNDTLEKEYGKKRC